MPDNWAHYSTFYNVPLDDFEMIMENALKNGYSFVWDGDVSENTFQGYSGFAYLPAFDVVNKNKKVTQEIREKCFDNYSTTEDHLMHVVGLAERNGRKFYYTKNSWGNRSAYNGYLYMSSSYVRLKTVFITVHKDAIPPKIKAKLGIR